MSENINQHKTEDNTLKSESFLYIIVVRFMVKRRYITSYFMGKIEDKTCRESGVFRSDGIPIGIWQAASLCPASMDSILIHS